MVHFQSAHGSGLAWRDTVQDVLSRLPPISSSANLGFVYVTDVLASRLAEILDLLRSRLSIEHWVGTVGIGICGTGAEYYEQPAMAVLVGAFPAESFKVFPGVRSSFEAFDRHANPWLSQAPPYFGVVHGDPRTPALGDLIVELSNRMQGGFLVGGLSSSRGEHGQIADFVGDGGLSGVLFNRAVPVVTRLTQGCSPVGARHRITRCESNLVLELDDRPALEVFQEDIGEVLARDLARAAGYIFVGLGVRGSDTGDYLVRNLIGVDPDQGVIAIGAYVEPGMSILFCRRDATTARLDLLRMLRDIKRGLSAPPKAGIYCSCIARGVNLFGPDSAELKLIEDELGDFPLVGFFANGEVSHDRLYGYTGVLTLFT